MWIAGQDEGIDADVLVLPNPRRNGRGIADQRRSGTAAHEADAGPEVRTDLELVAATAMQLCHALLADRVHAREDLLRACDGVIADMLDQFVRRLPGFRVGLADDDMETDAEGELAPAFGRGRTHALDLFG